MRDVLRFQRSPVVVRVVESMPTGRRPQVGPKTVWSTFMRCSPCVCVGVSVRIRRCWEK